MKLYLATENAGKVREMQAMLKQALPGAEVFSVADLTAQQKSAYRADETGTTYAANALIKARALAPLVDGLVLAEDSGFEVAELGGEPGVYSARYAADDSSRCAKILAALQGMSGERRAARFIACMVVLDEKGNPTYFFGRRNGYVADTARGNQGFGYDPIFCPALGGPTWGEMGQAEKNQTSHRRRSLDLVIQYLAGVVKGDTEYPP